MEIEFIKGFITGALLLVVIDVIYFLREMRLKKSYDDRLHKIEQNVQNYINKEG